MAEPVWQRPAWITAMVGVVSAFLTVPEIIGNYLAKEQDIELAKQKAEEARLANLDTNQEREFKIVSNTLAQQGEERVFVLRYLARTHDDKEARGWAEDEVKRVDILVTQKKKLSEAKEELQQTEEELQELRRKGEKDTKDTQVLEDRIKDLRAVVAVKDAEVSELRQKAGIANQISRTVAVRIVYRNDQGIAEEYEEMARRSATLARILRAIDFDVRIDDWLGFKEDGDPPMQSWMKVPSIWYRSDHPPTAQAAKKVQRLLSAASPEIPLALHSDDLQARGSQWSVPGPYSIQIWLF